MLTDQLFGTNGVTEGLGNLNGAWIQAYEIGIDKRTRVEKKTNLLNFTNVDDEEDKHQTNNTSSRGQMVHKSNRIAEKETLVELELSEDGRRIQPH